MQVFLALGYIIRKSFLLVKRFASFSCYNGKKIEVVIVLRLKELRIEYKMTQEELAKKLGVSRQVYANYENEINEPSLEMLIKIANLYQCSIDYLLGRSDDFGVINIPPCQDVVAHASTVILRNDEKELLALYRQLTYECKQRLIARAEVMIEAAGQDTKHGASSISPP